MQLQDCFEFEKFDTQFGPVERIRIKGHRIAIEHVIQYFKEGMEPQTIVRDIYPSLTQQEVYATITYYLLNQEAVDTYIRQGEEIGEAFYQEYLKKEPPEAIKRVRALKGNSVELARFWASRTQTPDGRVEIP